MSLSKLSYNCLLGTYSIEPFFSVAHELVPSYIRLLTLGQEGTGKSPNANQKENDRYVTYFKCSCRKLRIRMNRFELFTVFYVNRISASNKPCEHGVDLLPRLYQQMQQNQLLSNKIVPFYFAQTNPDWWQVSTGDGLDLIETTLLQRQGRIQADCEAIVQQQRAQLAELEQCMEDHRREVEAEQRRMWEIEEERRELIRATVAKRRRERQADDVVKRSQQQQQQQRKQSSPQRQVEAMVDDCAEPISVVAHPYHQQQQQQQQQVDYDTLRRWQWQRTDEWVAPQSSSTQDRRNELERLTVTPQYQMAQQRGWTVNDVAEPAAQSEHVGGDNSTHQFLTQYFQQPFFSQSPKSPAPLTDDEAYAQLNTPVVVAQLSQATDLAELASVPADFQSEQRHPTASTPASSTASSSFSSRRQNRVAGVKKMKPLLLSEIIAKKKKLKRLEGQSQRLMSQIAHLRKEQKKATVVDDDK